MPNQPTAKNVLKMNKNSAPTIPALLPAMLPVMASTTMERDWPVAPKSMSWRRPKRSIVKTAIQEARKYSVRRTAQLERRVPGSEVEKMDSEAAYQFRCMQPGYER